MSKRVAIIATVSFPLLLFLLILLVDVWHEAQYQHSSGLNSQLVPKSFAQLPAQSEDQISTTELSKLNWKTYESVESLPNNFFNGDHSYVIKYDPDDVDLLLNRDSMYFHIAASEHPYRLFLNDCEIHSWGTVASGQMTTHYVPHTSSIPQACLVKDHNAVFFHVFPKGLKSLEPKLFIDEYLRTETMAWIQAFFNHTLLNAFAVVSAIFAVLFFALAFGKAKLSKVYLYMGITSVFFSMGHLQFIFHGPSFTEFLFWWMARSGLIGAGIFLFLAISEYTNIPKNRKYFPRYALILAIISTFSMGLGLSKIHVEALFGPLLFVVVVPSLIFSGTSVVRYSRNEESGISLVVLGGVLSLLVAAGYDVVEYAIRHNVPVFWKTAYGFFILEVSLVILLAKERIDRESKLHQLNEDLEGAVTMLEESNGNLQGALAKAALADRQKSGFLLALSHGFRSPLQEMKGFVYDLLEQCRKNNNGNVPELMALANIVEKHSLHISIVRDLSQMYEGRFRLLREEVWLDQLIVEALEPVEALAKQQGVFFQFELSPGFPQTFLTDYNRLQNIFRSLIYNVIEHAGNCQATIVLNWNEKTELLEIEFNDTGKGMSENSIQNILQMDVHEHWSMLRSGSGGGMGLLYIQKVVNDFRGEFRMNARAEGGLSLRMKMPLKADYSNRKNETMKSDAKPKVLLVEDQLTNQKIVEGILKKCQSDVILASNGLEAIEQYSKENPDFVIMDVQMPVMNGLDATRKIRELEREQSLKETPIVALTANADRDACIQAGMSSYMSKPVNPKEVMRNFRVWMPKFFE